MPKSKKIETVDPLATDTKVALRVVFLVIVSVVSVMLLAFYSALI